MKTLVISALCGLIPLFGINLSAQEQTEAEHKYYSDTTILKSMRSNSQPFIFNKEAMDENCKESKPIISKLKKLNAHTTTSTEFIPPEAGLSTSAETTGCPSDWTPAVQLSIDKGFIPSIATQGDQYVHVTWSFTDSVRLRYARSTDGGLTFEIRDLTDWTIFPEGVATVKVLATEKYVYLLIVAMRHGNALSPVYFMKSTNNGETFEAARVTVDKKLIANMNFSAGGADALGDTIVFTMDRYRYFYYSTNAGLTWRIRHSRFGKLEYRVALSNGTLHLTYVKYGRRYRGGEIFYTRSTNLGRQWSRPVLLTTPDGYSSFEPYDISATKNGVLHIAWRDGKYGSWNGMGGSLIYRKSEDNGLTFGPEVVLTQIPEAVPGNPPINVEPNYGNPVAVAWHVDTLGFFSPPPANFQVKTRTSLDGGYSWCPEVNLTPEAEYASGTAVHVSSSRVFVAWNEDVPPVVVATPNVFIRSAPVKVQPVVRGNNPRPNGEGGQASPLQLNQEPLEFGLMQNYPNPFNPKTNVSFVISSRTAGSLVTLKVHDVLGREVAELVNNELLEAGEYEVEFDASHLPSGVYYYRLTVYDAQTNQLQYTAVNKCLLVK